MISVEQQPTPIRSTQADVGTAITVTAKYTDDNGTVESVVSNPTLTVLNVNDNPAGDVTIDGESTQNVVLAANTSTIQDERWSWCAHVSVA